MLLACWAGSYRERERETGGGGRNILMIQGRVQLPEESHGVGKRG